MQFIQRKAVRSCVDAGMLPLLALLQRCLRW
jgi:hypothetical protein